MYIIGGMHKESSMAIRLSLTPEVKAALVSAKKRYPTLSDPEILKLGLSKIITENYHTDESSEADEIRHQTAYAMGNDYLADPAEDIYQLGLGKKTDF